MSEAKGTPYPKGEIKQLITLMGGCIASNKIMVEGSLVGYMYREVPEFEHDSGWRFFSGTEDQAYADNADNFLIYDVNTVANCDKAIINYLHMPIGSQLERDDETNVFDEVS